jgi:large repetitive protein
MSRGFLAALVLFLSIPASANTITVTALDQGWYSDLGFHNPSNINYIVGSSQGDIYRNWFVFDLSALPTATVSSAVLRVRQPVGGFLSPNASEQWILHLFDSSQIAALRAGGSGLTALYDSLDDGAVVGTRTLVPNLVAENVETSLNAAGRAAAQSALGGFMVISGVIPAATAPLVNQFSFGGSQGNPVELDLTFATVNAIPEPSTLAGAGLVLALLFQRSRKSRS